MEYIVTTAIYSSSVSDYTLASSKDIEPQQQQSFCEPCNRDLSELIVFILFAVLIVVSNVLCISVSFTHQSSHHPENRHFLVNLAICNILCGLALLSSSLFEHMLTVETMEIACRVWCPIYKTCVMVPYVAVAVLGLDIAFYCQHAMDYHRIMTTKRLMGMLLGSWAYTFAVVGSIMWKEPALFCSHRNNVCLFF